MDNNELLVEKIIDIRSKMMLYIMNNLVGVATKKMRGITLNYFNKTMDINIFFDDELTEEEEEEMQQVDNDAISSAYPILYNWQGKPILNIEQMNLNFIVIPSRLSIMDEKGNLGWFYLRREYS